MYTRGIGSKWLEKKETLVLKIPSVLNEDNYNYLINPEHPHFSEVKIVSAKQITFDQRL